MIVFDKVRGVNATTVEGASPRSEKDVTSTTDQSRKCTRKNHDA